MAVEELLRSGRPLGPLVWALAEHGCALTLLPGPTAAGAVKVQLYYPEDEYLEKQCRRILADWRIVDTGTSHPPQSPGIASSTAP